MTNWPFDATQFTCLSLTCLLLLGISWNLLRDSVEVFQRAMANSDGLVPTTFAGTLRLIGQGTFFVAATVAAGLWLCGRVGKRPLAFPSTTGCSRQL